MAEDADKGHSDKNSRRQPEGHYDVTCYCKAVRDHADQVTEQNKHENGEDEREIFPPFRSHIVFEHISNKLVAEFCDGLHATGNH